MTFGSLFSSPQKEGRKALSGMKGREVFPNFGGWGRVLGRPPMLQVSEKECQAHEG